MDDVAQPRGWTAPAPGWLKGRELLRSPLSPEPLLTPSGRRNRIKITGVIIPG